MLFRVQKLSIGSNSLVGGVGGAILLQKWPGVVGSPTFAVNLCVCYNADDIVY